MKARIAFILSFSLAIGPWASAGTYNFFFNNTEQGANGNAAPTLTVGQPPVAAASSVPVPSPGPSHAAPVAEAAPSPVPSAVPSAAAPAAASDSQSVAQAAAVPSDGYRSPMGGVRLRMSGIGFKRDVNGTEVGEFGLGPNYNRYLGFDVGVYLFRYMAFNFFYSTQKRLGAELEVFPMKALSRNAGGGFEFSFLAGASTTGPSNQLKTYSTGCSWNGTTCAPTYASYRDDDWQFQGHLGARFGLLLADSVGFDVAYKHYVDLGNSIEAGVVFRL
ncbi:MAG: hypothetical protein JNL01_14655 [Bdellovibrionales bacterium]|nr:hypothetical protein [Bdellovibrionales bacterium]